MCFVCLNLKDNLESVAAERQALEEENYYNKVHPIYPHSFLLY